MQLSLSALIISLTAEADKLVLVSSKSRAIASESISTKAAHYSSSLFSSPPSLSLPPSLAYSRFPFFHCLAGSEIRPLRQPRALLPDTRGCKYSSKTQPALECYVCDQCLTCSDYT